MLSVAQSRVKVWSFSPANQKFTHGDNLDKMALSRVSYQQNY